MKSLAKASVSDLYYWMKEREKIRILKESGVPAPWTDDQILHRYKFTNVYREHDKGTRALRAMTPDNPNPRELIFNTFWYRIFNRFEHADDIGWCHSFEGFRELILAKQERGEKVWTSAHRVWAPKVGGITDHFLMVLEWVWDNIEAIVEDLDGANLEVAFDMIIGYRLLGVGPFLTYEIVTDFRHSILSTASDINRWCNIGPGSKRGLQRLGMPTTAASCRELMLHCPMIVELRDVEHSLCEFDKYWRVKHNEGLPRGVYHS